MKKRCFDLYLKKVEIHGFKSFADRTEIEFEKGITGVVGPNGSGKSNISDAIRWVLGEQSAKTLRGSRMEDVIFAGTTKRKPIGMAEVTLTLDNSAGKLPLDYSEVSVTRRVYRSGESEYYINKSLCRLKDIKEVFMDTGVGIDGYSIIGQGRIDEILSNKSEDRRIIFEEAAGIVKYKSRKEEAEKKLNNTNQNLVRVDDIIHELESRIEPLRMQSEKAKASIQMQDDMKNLEINLIIRELEQLKNNIETLKEQTNIINIQLNDYIKDRTGIEEKHLYFRKQMEELDYSISQLQKSIYETVHLKDRKEGELNLCNEKINNINENNNRLNNEIIVLNDNMQNLEIQLQDVKDKLTEVNNILNINQQALNSKITELEQMNNDLYKREEGMEKAKGSVIELLNNAANKRNELHSLDALQNNIVKRLVQIKEEIKQYGLKIESLLEGKNANLDDYNCLQNSFVDSKELKVEQQLQMEMKISKISELSKKIEEIKQKNHEHKTRKKLLEEMERDYEGFHQSVKKTLIYAKKNPDLGKGIIGVVAELMEVPKGLETAIEIALGNAMQNIVCLKAEDANRVINFLKKNDFGRVTLLPLDNIKSNSFQSLNKNHFANDAGFLGTAIESIHFSNTYRDIFEHLLGRVLLVDKIENGIRLARKTGNKYKIVSLDGDVINPGGSITGGSYRSKASSILSRKREIEEIEEMIKLIIEEYEQKKTVLEKANQEFESLKEEFAKNEQLIKEQEIHLININNTMLQIEKEIKSFEQNIERLEKEIRQLDNDKNESQASMNKVRKEINQIENEREVLQNSVLNSKYVYAEEKTVKEALTNEVTNLRIDFASLEQEKQHLEQKFKDISLKQDELLKMKEYKQREVEELSKTMNFLLNQQANAHIELKDADILRQQCEFNLSKEKTKKEELCKSYDDIELQLKKINDVITELHDSKHKIEMRLTRLEMQQDSYLNKLWEDYEVTYIEALTYKADDINIQEASKQIKFLKNKIKDIGHVNVNAIEEYKEVVERYEFLTAQKEDLINARNSLNKVIKEMDHTMRIQFMESFEKIKLNFNEVFQKMFGGGKAEIKLENEDEILTTGIEIVAQPPGKKLQNLLLLSGGERALTAIALLFAILKVKPTPFCILDEIEAALDDANVYRFADFLKEFTEDTQFIVVTHRKGTMEAVDSLYGITMQEEGVSTLVSVRLTEKAS